MVKAPLERVYAAYTNFEAMPKWSSHLAAVSITKREENMVHLESEEVSSSGRHRTIEGTLRLVPPGRVESEIETRFTRGRRTVTFENVPGEGSTKVTAELEVHFKGIWGVFLTSQAKKETAESLAMQELVSFARFVENSPE